MSEVAEQLRLNLESLVDHEPELIRRVYADLFEHHPQAAELFAEHSRAARGEMVREVLAFAIDLAEGETWVEENITSLGDKHEVNGVTHEMYSWFEDSLIRVLADLSGAQWCAELEGSWRNALAQVSGLMCSVGSSAAS